MLALPSEMTMLGRSAKNYTFMNLIYFDESKNDNDYQFYHIGAVAISEENLNSVESDIAEISEHCFGNTELKAETELHAVEIFHRKKNFKSWDDFEKRLDVIKRFLPILSRRDVGLIKIQIDCSKMYANYTPDEVAFMFLCERANGHMRCERTTGLLIGDRESDRVSASYAKSLSSYRTTGTDFRHGGEIDSLVDSVHFTHSHLSRFLQLADVYTWITQFCNRNRGSNNARHKAVFDLLKEDTVDLFPKTYKLWPK